MHWTAARRPATYHNRMQEIYCVGPHRLPTSALSYWLFSQPETRDIFSQAWYRLTKSVG
jgi:hypothetical protein